MEKVTEGLWVAESGTYVHMRIVDPPYGSPHQEIGLNAQANLTPAEAMALGEELLLLAWRAQIENDRRDKANDEG